jgi:hypothetical protein
MARWHAIERADAIARGEVLAEPIRSVVYVARPPGVGRSDDFDTYRPGADLRAAAATVAADGSVSLGAPRSLLGGCGLDPAVTDVRGVAVSWDAEHIAFGARGGAVAPLRLYRMGWDGSACEPVPGAAAPVELENGILTHDFHPAFAPDGRIVFASTRGDLGGEHRGPRRAPASMRPNANLYVWAEDEPVRQLTFLLDQELYPSFLFDGRVIYTTEKRAPDFHQLALRRQNLDGGDYHPLYASRGSLGFDAATEVRELPNQNFVFTAGAIGAPDGAGIIAIGNRSIGPDQDDRDPADRSYLHGMRTMPAGVFRSPAPLPTGRVVVSCAAPPAATPIDFDLCELDPATGTTRPLLGEAGVAEIEAVAVYRRVDRGVLRSDGRGIDHPLIEAGASDAVVHFNDFPMIASLMFENTREGRPLDQRIRGLDVVEALPPPAGAVDFDDLADDVTTDALGRFYAGRRVLGHVPLYADGSTKMRLPGGVPVLFQLTDGDGRMLPFPDGSAFAGEMFQREFEQYYPGERIQRSIPRRFFNAACGGCHGSISGRELDVAADPDIVSGASVNEARDAAPFDIMP